MHKPSIAVIGSLNMDIVVEADRSPQLGETILGNEAHFIPGGKGANQAVAAARLGARTTMIGAVGKDGFGSTLLEALAADGIETSKVKVVEGVATGIASILVAEKDNHIVVVPGANAHCLPEDLADLENVISLSDMILLQLEIPLETVCAAAELAKRKGKTVILNPAPAQELPDHLLEKIDYITPNRSELSILTGIPIEGDVQSLEKGMRALLEKGPSHVITTLGSKGSAYLSKLPRAEQGDGQDKQPTIVPSIQVPVVDTTGAGDAFNGGLAYAIATGQALPDAIMFATKVSALAVTKFGAQAGMPTLEEIK